MPKKRTPAEQNSHIKTMASMWEGRHLYPAPRCKVEPYFCEHCEWTMTKTGRLPTIKDYSSWYHWKGIKVCDDIGIRKVHSTSLHSQFGVCCKECAVFLEQSIKEYEDEAKAEGRYCEKTGEIYARPINTKPT